MTSLSTLLDLSGKVAIVTGATGQLGRAISTTLAEQGANIVVNSRTKSECEDFASQLSNSYQRSTAAAGDITEVEDVDSVIDRAVEEFGHLDILINNAYAGETPEFEELTLQDFQAGLETGISGPFLFCKSSIPELKKTEGCIVNISSIYGVVAPDHRIYENTFLSSPPHYGAAKASLIQFTRWLATRYAEDNIRANSITPGGIYNEKFEERQGYVDRFVPSYAYRTPLGRMGTPDDLRGAVAYLSSDASRWVTGQNMNVDGGWTAW
jgi:NAD(P)-dependent dehydrogenase (short-subunit alcohol dehydrogenase family)